MNLSEEMYNVYADCHMSNSKKAYALRNLNWRSHPVSLDEAHKAFVNACEGYNNFDTEKVFLKLKDICAPYEVSVSNAREGSPAIYLYAKNEDETKELLNKIKRFRSLDIDEIFIENKTTIRMWWD